MIEACHCEPVTDVTGVAIPQNTPRAIDKRTGAGAPRLPCVKGAVMAVSRKAMTEGLSEWASSDPLSPSVRTGAAPLGQQGEPLRSAISSRKYRGIVTGGNPRRGPHQRALH